jgi:hypothetical protein
MRNFKNSSYSGACSRAHSLVLTGVWLQYHDLRKQGRIRLTTRFCLKLARESLKLSAIELRFAVTERRKELKSSKRGEQIGQTLLASYVSSIYCLITFPAKHKPVNNAQWRYVCVRSCKLCFVHAVMARASHTK